MKAIKNIKYKNLNLFFYQIINFILTYFIFIFKLI